MFIFVYKYQSILQSKTGTTMEYIETEQLGQAIVDGEATVANLSQSDKINVKDYECFNVFPGKFCAREISFNDDEWGARTVTSFIKIDNNTGELEEVYATIRGSAPRFMGSSSDKNKIYYSRFGYESSGPGSVFMIDRSKATTTTIALNAYGEVSPNGRYYATYGDIDSGNGSQFCNNSEEHGNTLPASALRLLDFNTSVIKVVKEDESKIFIVTGWNKASDKIFYTQSDLIPDPKGYDCPVLTNKVTGEVSI